MKTSWFSDLFIKDSELTVVKGMYGSKLGI